jgi:sulfur relay (sulfurtransferase) complex TusBCD TusD component (DsrE family)
VAGLWWQHLPTRLLAVRVPQEVAAARRRRLRAAARKKGRQASATRLALAAWTLLVTNGPSDRLTLREALVLARVRWQIELLLKWWMRHGRVDESRSTKPWRILCEVYAQLLAMLVQHGVWLVSCWAYPHRSLVKAAQTGQKQALHLASTLGSLRRFLTALSTVQRCVAAGCRMNRRKKHPNTYQLLFNDLSMTTA